MNKQATEDHDEEKFLNILASNTKYNQPDRDNMGLCFCRSVVTPYQFVWLLGLGILFL